MTQALYFAIRPDDHGARFVSASFSRDPVERTRWQPDDWSPYGPLEVDCDLRLTQAEITRVQGLYLHVNCKRSGPVNVIGFHSLGPNTIVVVSDTMRSAMTALDPGAFDFVHLPHVVSTTRYNLPEGTYHLARPMIAHDALNIAQSDLDHQISTAPLFFPRQFNGPNRVFDHARLPGSHYFRDATTGEGICTAEFRDMAETVGCRGWLFYDCRVIG